MALKVYVAGKVAKDSQFGKHHWRDEFVAELEKLSGLKLENLDPLAGQTATMAPKEIFAKDCRLIADADVLIVYLSDDISVGGAQEILIARYLKRPVIGLAPRGGKFNGATREMFGQTITNYQDPFVFTTCDFVCDSIEAVAQTLQKAQDFTSAGLAIIDTALES